MLRRKNPWPLDTWLGKVPVNLLTEGTKVTRAGKKRDPGLRSWDLGQCVGRPQLPLKPVSSPQTTSQCHSPCLAELRFRCLGKVARMALWHGTLRFQTTKAGSQGIKEGRGMLSAVLVLPSEAPC